MLLGFSTHILFAMQIILWWVKVLTFLFPFLFYSALGSFSVWSSEEPLAVQPGLSVLQQALRFSLGNAFRFIYFFGFFRGAPYTGHLWRFLPECGLGIKGDIRIRETGAQTVRMAVLVRVTCGIWPASGMMCKTVCWNGHCWATKFNFLMERYRRNLRVDTCYTPWTPQS